MKIWQLRSLILKRVFFAFTAPSPPVHTGCHWLTCSSYPDSFWLILRFCKTLPDNFSRSFHKAFLVVRCFACSFVV